MIGKALAWIEASAVWLGICAALTALAWLHGCQTGIDKERERTTLAQVKAVQKARDADAAATKAVAHTKNQIEAGNERARNAAENSDDPLGDALRELRR